MKNWRKENRIRMSVTYTLDKYRENDGERMPTETVEGFWAYLNNPSLGTFVNIELDNGEYHCISRDLVQKIEFKNMPKWNIIEEAQVVDSSKVRKLNLDNELEIAKNTFDQEQRAKETRNADV